MSDKVVLWIFRLGGGFLVLCVLVFVSDGIYRGCIADPVTKVIVSKGTDVQGTMTGVSGKSGGYVGGSQWTNYYLVAEDGSTVAVGRGRWHTTNVGESYSSTWWRNY